MLVKQKIVCGRRKLGISTPQLAEMIDVNQGTINRYENGTIKTIPTDKLRKLAEVLGYSFEEFISGDPRYSMLGDKQVSEGKYDLDEDDGLIINWFHHLPKEYQLLFKQFISLSTRNEV